MLFVIELFTLKQKKSNQNILDLIAINTLYKK